MRCVCSDATDWTRQGLPPNANATGPPATPSSLASALRRCQHATSSIFGGFVCLRPWQSPGPSGPHTAFSPLYNWRCPCSPSRRAIRRTQSPTPVSLLAPKPSRRPRGPGRDVGLSGSVQRAPPVSALAQKQALGFTAIASGFGLATDKDAETWSCPYHLGSGRYAI